MACFHPIKGFHKPGGGFTCSPTQGFKDRSMLMECGQCLGCRMKKSSDWTTRVMLEAKFHTFCWFVTLTYSDKHLPEDYSCHVKHLQAFHHRLRKWLERRAKAEKRPPDRLRFHTVSDYGAEFWRPHYHGSYFGFDIPDRVPAEPSKNGHAQWQSEELSALWGMGIVVFSPLTREAAGYCARHNLDKVTGAGAAAHYHRLNLVTGEFVWVEPEFMICSRGPGIGHRFFEEFERDIFPSDFLVSDGKKIPIPRYYARLVKERDKANEADEFGRVRRARLKKARSPEMEAHRTPARLRTREESARLKQARLKREL
jgi:hypothetical protein